MQYRRQIRASRHEPLTSYTNDLHEALLNKDGPAFWKSWRANFEARDNCSEVDNCVDSDIIVKKFAAHFASAFEPNNAHKSEKLYDEYVKMRSSYYGWPLRTENNIDTELVGNKIARLHCRKAADIDGLTAEHLLYSHPSLPLLLCKLFQLIIRFQYVPKGFKQSYIVPVPKLKITHNKTDV